MTNRRIYRAIAIAVGVLLGLYGASWKGCFTSLHSPCASLTVEQIGELTGITPGGTKAVNGKDSCEAEYPYFDHDLVRVQIQRTADQPHGSLDEVVERLKRDEGFKSIEPVEGLGGTAYVVRLEGSLPRTFLLAERRAAGGYLSVCFFTDRYEKAFTSADARRAIPMLTPHLAAVDEHLRTLRPH